MCRFCLHCAVGVLLYGHKAATNSAQMPKSEPNVAATKQKSAHKKSAPSSALLVRQPCVFNAGFSLPFLSVGTQGNNAVQRKGANLHTIFFAEPALSLWIDSGLVKPFNVVLADFHTVEEIG